MLGKLGWGGGWGASTQFNKSKKKLLCLTNSYGRTTDPTFINDINDLLSSNAPDC